MSIIELGPEWARMHKNLIVDHPLQRDSKFSNRSPVNVAFVVIQHPQRPEVLVNHSSCDRHRSEWNKEAHSESNEEASSRRHVRTLELR